MYDTMITLTGNVGGDPQVRQVHGVTVANFRVACTPRRFNRDNGEWEDGDTEWYSVAAWRTLGENCARSIRTGDAVVIQGRLSVDTWTTKGGLSATSFEVDAQVVGHDLSRGVSRFSRPVRTEAGEVDRDTGEITGPVPAETPAKVA